jgi:RNA polymerase sigma factor (sigma-70 family)
MVSNIAPTYCAAQLAEDNLPIARTIASSLKWRYPWVPTEDLRSFSLWGLMLAAKAYSSDTGMSFLAFALWKAKFLAVDRMRKERVLRRKPPPGSKPWPRQQSLTMDIPDQRSPEPTRAMEISDFVRSALRRLPARDRQILLMYYVDDMTFREIGCALHMCESYVCVRHKASIAELRRAARARARAS